VKCGKPAIAQAPPLTIKMMASKNELNFEGGLEQDAAPSKKEHIANLEQIGYGVPLIKAASLTVCPSSESPP
jgi:hypothetical protein